MPEARLTLLRPAQSLAVVQRAGSPGVLVLGSAVPASGSVLLSLAGALRGERGLPGASQSRYIHTQASAAAVWTVPHNLAGRPAVTVVDHLARQIHPDVEWLDDNIVQITHGSAITGAVYCS